MRLRPPIPADAPAVLAVIIARDIADLGEPDYTLGDLQDDWQSSEVDLTADAIVVEDGGPGIVGYAFARRRGADVIVHPDREGQGIGTRLRAWVEARDRNAGRDRHRQAVGSRNARAQAFLERGGYRRTRSYWRMARRLEDLAPIPPTPEGVLLRALEPAADAEALHALDAQAFAGNADYEPESLSAFREEHLAAHDLDPRLSIVAERSAAIVGFLLGRRWEQGVGYIDLLAVHPDERGQGLGSTLLLTAFAGFAAGGLSEARLGVASDNPNALRLYERVGMAPRFRVDVYVRACP